MPLVIAYIGVVLIWATTPLAIQWSSESVGYLFGISARFVLGAVVAVALAWLLGKRLCLRRDAILTYLVAGTGASLAMICVYWGSRFIPSGWVSLIFGMSPIVTALLAARLLGERGLSPLRLVAISFGLGGLYLMLESGDAYHPDAAYGMAAVLLSVLFYSLNLVFVKRINADLDVFSTVLGTLLVMAFFSMVLWFASGNRIPTSIPVRAGVAISYLAIIGSVLGFMLFYYVLRRVEATRASLITLLTPVCAILLGHMLNNEPFNQKVVQGSTLILSGLLLFEFEVGISHQLKQLFRGRENERVRDHTGY